MNEAYTYLTNLMDAQVETISYLMYANFAARQQHTLLPDHVRTCLINFLRQCTLQARMKACIDAVQENSPYRRAFIELFGPAIEENVDVVLCQFPGFQCGLFSELRVGLALRFTHRFDHHIWYGGSDAKADWDRMVVQWHTRMAHAAIFADNPYDAEYLWHFLRVPAISWPAVGLRLIMGNRQVAKPSNQTRALPSSKRLNVALKRLSQRRDVKRKPKKTQWCWCCQGAKGYYTKTDKLTAHLQSLVPDINIGFIKEHKVNPDADSLAQTSDCTAFILIPHSLHSYTSVEVYAVGYPMVVPSASLMAQWHAKWDVIQHRCPGNKPWMPSLQAPSDSPLSSETADISRWLTHVDFLRWPHVRVLNSEGDLRRVMAGTPHSLQPEQPRYFQLASFEALPRIETTLRGIAQASQENRTRDGLGEPQWAQSRALIHLAAWCQARRMRVRSQLRAVGKAEEGWKQAQGGAFVTSLCERGGPPPKTSPMRPAAPQLQQAVVHGKFVGAGFCDATRPPPPVRAAFGGGSNARAQGFCPANATEGRLSTRYLSDCYMRCVGCVACNFISFNEQESDCSWHSTCAQSLYSFAFPLSPGSNGTLNPHLTYRVRASDGTLHNDSSVVSLPPPPPSPPKPPPPPSKTWCMVPI